MSNELDALERFYDDVVVYSEYLYEHKWLDDELYRKYIERIEKDFNLLKQALKRNEPMKVDLETGTWVNYVEYYKCPNCTGRAVEIWHRFCPDCGQALDGSDEE